MAKAPMILPAPEEIGVDQQDCSPCDKAIGHQPYSAHRVSVLRSVAITCLFRCTAMAQGPDSTLMGRPTMEVMKLVGRLGAAPFSRRLPLGSTNTTLQ